MYVRAVLVLYIRISCIPTQCDRYRVQPRLCRCPPGVAPLQSVALAHGVPGIVLQFALWAQRGPLSVSVGPDFEVFRDMSGRRSVWAPNVLIFVNLVRGI